MTRLHPVTFFWLAAAASSEAFLLDARGNTLLALVMISLLLCRRAARDLLRRFLPQLALLIGFVFLLNTLLYPEDSAAGRNDFGLSGDGATFAWTICARILVLISAQLLFFTAAQPHRLVEVWMIGNLSHTFGYLFLYTISLRQLLGHKVSAVLEAQQSRGLRVGGRLLTRARALIPVLGPIVFSYLQEGIWRAIALSLKGFGSDSPYTTLWLDRQPASEKLLSGVAFGIVGLTLMGKIIR